jgi:hypothetical protein
MRFFTTSIALAVLALSFPAGAAFARAAVAPGVAAAAAATSTRTGGESGSHHSRHAGRHAQRARSTGIARAARSRERTPVRPPARPISRHSSGTAKHSLRRSHRDGQRFATLSATRVLDASLASGLLERLDASDFSPLTLLRESGRGPPRASPDQRPLSLLRVRQSHSSARTPPGPTQSIAIDRTDPAVPVRRGRLRARRRARRIGRAFISGVRPHTPARRFGGSVGTVSGSPVSGGFPMKHRPWFVAPALGAILLVAPLLAHAGTTAATPAPTAKSAPEKAAPSSAVVAQATPSSSTSMKASTTPAPGAPAAPSNSSKSSSAHKSHHKSSHSSQKTDTTKKEAEKHEEKKQ